MIACVETGPVDAETIVFLHGGNVAGWMWGYQVEALRGEFHILVPDLPGFGASNDRRWTGVADAAREVRAVVAARAHGGRAHVVGLSLGALVALEMLAEDATADDGARPADGAGGARVPGCVASAVVSSALVVPSSRVTRSLARFQLRLWDRPWYWRATARAFGIPAEDREVFVQTGLGIAVESERAVVEEVVAGRGVASLARVSVPVLAVAGSKDQRRVRADSLRALASAIPAATCAVAPGGHHHWNAEQPEVFTAMVRDWVLRGRVAEGLVSVAGAPVP